MAWATISRHLAVLRDAELVTAAAGLLLSLVTVAACLIPAWRATATSPGSMLRSE